jgi:hypothetical protein
MRAGLAVPGLLVWPECAAPTGSWLSGRAVASHLSVWVGPDDDSRSAALNADEKRSKLLYEVLEKLVPLDVEWDLEWDYRTTLDAVEEDTGGRRGGKVGEGRSRIDGRLSPQRGHPLLAPAS